MDRRIFVRGVTGLAVAASLERLGAQAARLPPVKTVRTGVLEIGYYESKGASAFPVILLHGFQRQLQQRAMPWSGRALPGSDGQR